jgi:hypothetical protein
MQMPDDLDLLIRGIGSHVLLVDRHGNRLLFVRVAPACPV